LLQESRQMPQIEFQDKCTYEKNEYSAMQTAGIECSKVAVRIFHAQVDSY